MKNYFIFLCLFISCGLASATIQTTTDQDKPARLYVKSYSIVNNGTVTTTNGEPWNNNISTYNENMNWQDGVAGSYYRASKEYDYNEYVYYGSIILSFFEQVNDINQSWLPYFWPNTQCSEIDTGFNATYNSTGGSVTNVYDVYTNDYANTNASIFQEHCDVNFIANLPPAILDESWGIVKIDFTQINYRRTANTVMKLQTGGKAISKLKNLFYITATATQNNPTNYSWDLPPGNEGAGNYSTNIPSQNITIGSYGALINTNGGKYLILSDNADVDVTPSVAGISFYSFSMGTPQKYHSYIDVYAEEATPYDPTSTNSWPSTSIEGENDVGHAFFRLRTDVPSDALQYIGQGQNFTFTNGTHIFSTNMTVFLGMNVGFYPSSNNIIFSYPIPLYVSGQTYAPDPCTTPTVLRTFSVGFDDLIDGLEFTKQEYLTPPTYELLGYNCVEAAKAAFGAVNGDVFGKLPLDETPEWFGIKLNLLYPGSQLSDTNIYDSR